MRNVSDTKSSPFILVFSIKMSNIHRYVWSRQVYSRLSKKKKWRLVNFKGISILVDPSHEKYDWYSTLLTSILVCMPKYK